MMAIMTNSIGLLTLSSSVLTVQVAMAQMIFVENGNKLDEWKDPEYGAITKVGF